MPPLASSSSSSSTLRAVTAGSAFGASSVRAPLSVLPAAVAAAQSTPLCFVLRQSRSLDEPAHTKDEAEGSKMKSEQNDAAPPPPTKRRRGRPSRAPVTRIDDEEKREVTDVAAESTIAAASPAVTSASSHYPPPCFHPSISTPHFFQSHWQRRRPDRPLIECIPYASPQTMECMPVKLVHVNKAEAALAPALFSQMSPPRIPAGARRRRSITTAAPHATAPVAAAASATPIPPARPAPATVVGGRSASKPVLPIEMRRPLTSRKRDAVQELVESRRVDEYEEVAAEGSPPPQLRASKIKRRRTDALAVPSSAARAAPAAAMVAPIAYSVSELERVNEQLETSSLSSLRLLAEMLNVGTNEERASFNAPSFLEQFKLTLLRYYRVA
jgi:hypothetical protein